MDIKFFWRSELPDTLSGIAVVVDVYASTSNIAYFLSQKPKRLIIANYKNVTDLKQKYPNSLVVGESFDLPESFFDVSNNPTEISKMDFRDKELIFMSYNGTKVIETAFVKGVSTVFALSFTNFSTTAEFLANNNSSSTINLIAAGESTQTDHKSMEDYYCLEMLKAKLVGREVDSEKYLDQARKFMLNYYASEPTVKSDIEIVTSLDQHQVVAYCQKTQSCIEVINSSKKE